MEQLDSHIFHAITKLGNNKRQSYENSIYNYNLKTGIINNSTVR